MNICSDLALFLYTSETVKFGHVTFFWNGNRSGCFNSEKEEYVEIPSDSGITFNVKPKMKALEVGEKARDAILSGKFDQVNRFIRLNSIRLLTKRTLKGNKIGFIKCKKCVSVLIYWFNGLKFIKQNSCV